MGENKEEHVHLGQSMKCWVYHTGTIVLYALGHGLQSWILIGNIKEWCMQSKVLYFFLNYTLKNECLTTMINSTWLWSWKSSGKYGKSENVFSLEEAVLSWKCGNLWTVV
jgi:hypothetical protein